MCDAYEVDDNLALSVLPGIAHMMEAALLLRPNMSSWDSTTAELVATETAIMLEAAFTDVLTPYAVAPPMNPLLHYLFDRRNRWSKRLLRFGLTFVDVRRDEVLRRTLKGEVIERIVEQTVDGYRRTVETSPMFPCDQTMPEEVWGIGGLQPARLGGLLTRGVPQLAVA